MKKNIITILCLLLLIQWNGCSKTTDTQLRIKNEKMDKINMSIQTSARDKFNINDIEPGQTTTYQTVSEGNITVINITQNESVSFVAAKNSYYTIIIGTGKPPSVQLDK